MDLGLGDTEFISRHFGPTPDTVKSTTFWFSSPKRTRKPFPPTSGTVPDSTNNLCQPSQAFEPSFNHLQPTCLLSTNLKPEPDSATQAQA
ncbi:hypothetical protein CROQUDRAFT_90914 [Cronartium quercuum f. sp. fusiforme G11]|uniref:Uncharacterized protein n=1 Tax=Cronartium quercuum f. sp. fusiforme G11 TaxID=708437 RepID=A0A9P6TD38_9BASI|nr:hypothetical protein CROQUDRAFT_90914 [Cronartium quercuum f. sp. fusiforme G11]